ncbi:carbohydrate ABC transporter permease [Caldalkalibacillus mannanilyticus]|uniref:carbohydrate ABC transporter permease n=1 Tax=Caldalkalibacillus mannanilyticus TaxID=1418 RepID=UPI00046897E2|nr:sugar ABC transporter permease [Caldalkalibacillus mannanilyticus]
MSKASLEEITLRRTLSKEIERKRALKKEWRLFFEGLLYMLPALMILGLFLFYPMLKTLYYSFFITNPRGDTVLFVGLEHYLHLLQSESFRQSMIQTFLFVLYTVPTGVILALFLAVIANERVRGIEFFRVIFSSTLGVSVAAGATIWLFLFHPSIGLFNQVLQSIGLSPVAWLTSKDWALFSVAIPTIWMSVGFNFIILLGGLQNISDELYESARIDGAGYFTQLFKITLPMLSPTLFFIVTVTLIGSFQSFGQIHILTGGGPNEATNIIVYSIYKEAFEFSRFGTASAQAILLFIIILVFTILQFKVGERKVHYQ